MAKTAPLPHLTNNKIEKYFYPHTVGEQLPILAVACTFDIFYEVGDRSCQSNYCVCTLKIYFEAVRSLFVTKYR